MAFYSEAPKTITDKNPFPHTSSQHALLLHPLKAQGQATVARNLPQPVGWKEQCWEPWELEAVLVRAEGQLDTYLSQNRFRGDRRAVAQVQKLCGLFSDVDYYDVPELRGLLPEAVLEKVLERLREEGLPDPSLALSSGQGLALIWRHAPCLASDWRSGPRPRTASIGCSNPLAPTPRREMRRECSGSQARRTRRTARPCGP